MSCALFLSALSSEVSRVWASTDGDISRDLPALSGASTLGGLPIPAIELSATFVEDVVPFVCKGDFTTFSLFLGCLSLPPIIPSLLGGARLSSKGVFVGSVAEVSCFCMPPTNPSFFGLVAGGSVLIARLVPGFAGRDCISRSSSDPLVVTSEPGDLGALFVVGAFINSDSSSLLVFFGTI